MRITVATPFRSKPFPADSYDLNLTHLRFG
jgi:hypothetical protein